MHNLLVVRRPFCIYAMSGPRVRGPGGESSTSRERRKGGGLVCAVWLCGLVVVSPRANPFVHGVLTAVENVVYVMWFTSSDIVTEPTQV